MDLIQKYNIPAPRYTSYPTVPFWNNGQGWEAAINSYTVTRTTRLLGLGVSAIGDHGIAYTQNEKNLAAYQQALDAGRLPVARTHVQSAEDLRQGRHIRELMCTFETACTPSPEVLKHLQEPQRDGLVVVEADRVVVTEKGRPYIRNICMAFDAYLWKNSPHTQVFSGAI